MAAAPSRARRASSPATRPRASRARRDARALGRSEAPYPLRIVAARGSRVFDLRGDDYVDLLAGWCVGNLGWNHPDIQDALAHFDGPDYVFPHFEYDPWDELAERLTRMAPGNMARAWRATGGSEAVDLAMQATMLATKRRRFVSLEGCYHGNTLGALSLSAAGKEAPLKGFGPAARHLRAPLDERALRRLETALKRRDVAALVMEPIPLALGVEVPTAEFMEGAQRLCRKHGTLLVLDEVATGFGRTGRMFAAEHFDVEPDVVVLGKGITAGHAPMGALLMTEAVAAKVEDDMEAYSTYGWHPRSVAAALAALDVYEGEREALLGNVEARGEQLRDALEEMDFAGAVEVRAKGLAVMAMVDDETYAEEIVDRCRREGVLLTSEGERLQMFPALNVDRPTTERALARMARCV